MRWELVAVALIALPLAAMPVEAVPGPAVGDCEIYRHQSVAAVALVVNAGDNEIWSTQPGCGIARSSTQVLQWGGQFHGPVTLGFTTITWTGFGFSGCTLGTIQVSSFVIAAFTASAAVATLTMTSNECHGWIVFRAFIGTGVAYDYTVVLPINVRVEQDFEAFPTTINSVVSGELDVHQDEACGAVTPCQLEGDLGFTGNFSTSTNNTVTGDFERVFVEWFPLWMGVVMIFIAIRRREAVEPNALMIAGVLLSIAAIVCPFPGHPQWLDPTGLALRVAVVGIAIWCWMRYATARKDWNTGEDAP